MNRKERRHMEKSARKGRMTPEMNIPEALQQMISLYEKGRLREALRICRNLLALVPGDEDLLHMAGAIAAQIDDPEAAIELLQAAIEAAPDHADAHYNLGNSLRALGRRDEAIEAFRTAIRCEPGMAEAHNNLGITLAETGQFEAAVEAYARAIELRPGHAAAHSNLAIVLHELGRTAEAEAACRQAIEQMPAMAEAHNGLANILKFQGRTEEALESYGRAIELNPHYAEAYNNMGILFHEQRNLDGAISASRRAIELMPTLVEAYRNLGYSLQQQARTDEARQVYERAEAITADPGVAVRKALLLPLFPDSREEIESARDAQAAALADLRAKKIRIDDPLRQAGVTNFFLAYHGLDDRPLQEELAGLLRDACPELSWEAPHCAEARTGDERRRRIGFVSRYLIDSHTIGKLFGGLIARLPKDRFETTIFRPTAVANAVDTGADRVVHLSESLFAARAQIAATEMDVLVYLDIGMEPLSYLLAFSRLAPKQFVTFGHPVTTGLETLDGYLSTAALDPEGNEAHYTEPLVRLPRLPVYYNRLGVSPEGLPDRDALGLPADRHLYVCTQTLFKVHPDFDAVLAAILERDPQGTVVFIEGSHRQMARQLAKRLSRLVPDVEERVLFLPALNYENFLGLSKAADVLLDTLHFSGGNTSLEGLALGTPVVTWPSQFMRGRWTAAVYADMGIDDMVAVDPEAYVDLALRCAGDAAWREQVSGKILDQGAAFFENDDAVTGFAEFLERELAS